jgi:D-3-phosphoglycerate dehydrogenase
MTVVTLTDPGPWSPSAIGVLSADERVLLRVLPPGLDAREAARLSADSDVVIVGLLAFDEEAMRRLEVTRLIVRCSTGLDMMDVGAATRQGIWLANVPDYCTEDVADHTMLLILAGARRLRHFQQSWDFEGRWLQTDPPPLRRVSSLRLGLVGFGRIAQAVAVRARAFGMAIAATDPAVPSEVFEAAGVRRCDLDELLASSDVLSLHAPLTSGSRRLIDRERLSLLPRGAVIVNTARGALLDLDALEEGLRTGHVGAACLDVLEREPPSDHPVLSREDVLITPHIGWYSVDAQQQLGRLAAQAVITFLDGGYPPGVSNPHARSAGTV